MVNCGIVLLAAGASKRLGVPKQLLKYNNKTLLQHCLDEIALTPAVQSVVVYGANKDLILPTLTGASITTLYNPKWAEGISTSIIFGLTKLLEIAPHIDAALFMVCDQPYISSSLLTDMLNAYGQSGKEIIACEYSNSTIGTPVLFHKKYFQQLLYLTGDEGAKKIIKNYLDDVYTTSFPKGYIDIDTFTDYQQLTK